MINQSINEALNNLESEFEIDIRCKISNTTCFNATVTGSNTLGQVLKEYSGDIGINPNNGKNIFENKRTGIQTSVKNMTIAELELIGGYILLIYSDCA